MSKYSLKELAGFMGGELYGNDMLVSGFSIDSRTLKNGDVFFCIKGENYDGHDFIDDCLKKSSCIVSSREINPIDLNKKSYIKVKDTLEALKKASEYVRSKCNAKFIAITGSNGKTTVKEMLAHILSNHKISYTKGNLNNHIGVPLTLLSINNDDEFVIVECGSNNLGEIKPLSKLIKPNIAAVTNIGYAHIEGFKTLNNTAKEKYSIFDYIQKDGLAVINIEDKYCDYINLRNKIFFGYSINFRKKFKKILKNLFYKTIFLSVSPREENCFEIEYKGKKELIKINLNGKHNILNAACACSIALSLNIKFEEIKNKIETFDSVNSRLKLYNLKKNISIIDDCYNANPSSFKAAISYLADLKGNKIILMGDMAELGKNSKHFHEEIGIYAQKNGVSKFLSIGNHSKYASSIFGENGHHFTDKESLKSYLNNNIEPSSYILIKGSRNQKLEEYVNFLKNRER